MANTTGDAQSIDPQAFRASLRQMVRDAKNDDSDARAVAAAKEVTGFDNGPVGELDPPADAVL